jgi:hypothetical protein
MRVGLLGSPEPIEVQEQAQMRLKCRRRDIISYKWDIDADRLDDLTRVQMYVLKESANMYRVLQRLARGCGYLANEVSGIKRLARRS